jgi:hypothetical protein
MRWRSHASEIVWQVPGSPGSFCGLLYWLRFCNIFDYFYFLLADAIPYLARAADCTSRIVLVCPRVQPITVSVPAFPHDYWPEASTLSRNLVACLHATTTLLILASRLYLD